jgi:DNA-binding CsgD family transcriptional regulator
MKHKPGRGNDNRWCPKADDRAQIEDLAAQGSTHDAIAVKLGVSRSTLVKHCRTELDRGKIRNENALLAIMMRHAIAPTNPGVSFNAAKFLLAARHKVFDADTSQVTALEAKVAQLEAQIAAQAGAEDADIPDVEITTPVTTPKGAPAFDMGAALTKIMGRLN